MGMRDVTRALVLVALVQRQTKNNPEVQADLEELTNILVDVDARSGRRDPSKRGKRSAENAGK